MANSEIINDLKQAIAKEIINDVLIVDKNHALRGFYFAVGSF